MKSEDDKMRISSDELKYLLTGLVAPDEEVEERANPVESFLDNKQWQQLMELSCLTHFSMLPDDIERNPVAWKKFVQSSNEPIPDPIGSYLPDFSQILLFKVLKPEKTIAMIQKYIEKTLGSFFIKPIIYQLDEIYADSKANIPIILILTPGNDPMEQIKKFGEERGRIPYPVSLGKGQGEKAKALINEIRQGGGWVVLQNCHLAASFLPELEQIVENLQPVTMSKKQQDEQDNTRMRPPNPEFRLWLTSMSTDNFPFSILQNSIKLTSEPPKGLKSSLIRTYHQIDNSKLEKEFFLSNSKPEQWKKLFLALSFFHGILRERRRYGPLGWNLKYDFNDSDFRISMRQLHMMIDTFDQVPFQALSYLTGECNYGGRVTDDWDRRTLNTILKEFYNRHCLRKEHKFVPGLDQYFILQQGEFEDYMTYIQNLPDEEFPMIVGLNENANITQAINESITLLSDILSVARSSNSGGPVGSQNQQAIKMASELLYSIREPFKIKEVEKKFPFKYEESMNSVLLQELARFNNLIDVIKSSLITLIKTLEGKIVMTQEIEKMFISMNNNAVPDLWKARSYPSRKPLLSYVKDLQKRLHMLDSWIHDGQPNWFWISGFFFTQSFLTGVKQNFARKYKYPIDKVTFAFEVLKYEFDISKQPDNGCYIKGLFLEGAGWNNKQGHLEESALKVLYVEMPAMHFLPVLEKEESIEAIQKKQEQQQQQAKKQQETDDEDNYTDEEKEKQLALYSCPVYKTGSRAGTLSTTGHSTNYILTTQLPTFESQDLWIKRSVALLSQLDD